MLCVAAVVVARQFWKVRQDEVTLARLERQGNQANKTEASDAASFYELGSVQLRKRLFGQAVESLSEARGVATAEEAPEEAVALIENALGFALAAQNNYKLALKHYRAALKAKPDYPVASTTSPMPWKRCRTPNRLAPLIKRCSNWTAATAQPSNV